MQIERYHNGYCLVLDREEAITLMGELGAAIGLLKVRLKNRTGSDRGGVYHGRGDKRASVTSFHHHSPERNIRIELEDLPLPVKEEGE